VAGVFLGTLFRGENASYLREMWWINEILSNCVFMCFKAFPTNQCCPPHLVILLVEAFEEKKVF